MVGFKSRHSNPKERSGNHNEKGKQVNWRRTLCFSEHACVCLLHMYSPQGLTGPRRMEVEVVCGGETSTHKLLAMYFPGIVNEAAFNATIAYFCSELPGTLIC